MDWQSMDYALIQVAHNFGAVAVVSGPLLALVRPQPRPDIHRKLAWLVLAGWSVQGVSGGAFGAVSFYFYGHFPDIHGIAIAALLIKIACASSGIVLMVYYLRRANKWSARMMRRAWRRMFTLGAIALTAAAFLRWFS